MKGQRDQSRALGRSGGRVRRLVVWFATSRMVEALSAIGDQSVASILMLALKALLGRACSEAAFGAFGISQTVLLFLGFVRHALVEVPVMVFVPAEQRGQRSALLGAAFLLESAVAGTFALGMAAVVGTMLALDASSELVRAMAGMAVAAVFVAFRESLRAGLYGMRRSRTVLAIGVASRTLLAAGLLVLFFRKWLDPLSAWLLLAGSEAVGALISRAALSIRPRAGWRRLWQAAAQFWEFGRWMTMSNIMMWVARSLPIIVLGAMLGAKGVAPMIAAMALLRPLGLMAAPFSSIYVARGTRVLSGSGPRAMAQYLAGGRMRLAGIVVLSAVLLGATAPWLLHMVFGGRYDAAAWIVRALSVQMCLMFVVRSLSAKLICLRRTDLHCMVHVVCGCLSLLCVGPVIAWFGVEGCVGLMLAVEAAYLVLFWRVGRHAVRRAEQDRMSADQALSAT